MLRVGVESIDADQDNIAIVANRTQSWFRFVGRTPEPTRDGLSGSESRPCVLLTDEEIVAPFVVSRKGPILISTWQAKPIARYAGIDTTEYWVICAMMGLVQWRTLALNSLLIPEDFIHEPTIECLYGAHDQKSEFGLLLERGGLCRGCRDFYHCLGADRELLALVETADALLHRRD